MSVGEDDEETSRPKIGFYVLILLTIVGYAAYQAVTHIEATQEVALKLGAAIATLAAVVVAGVIGIVTFYKICYYLGWLILDAPSRFLNHLSEWR